MSQLVLIGFLSLAALGVLFTPAQATNITLQCGDTVGPGGSFTLMAPVGPCSGPGITVDSATLDMAHLDVTCTGLGGFTGVTVIGTGAVVKNGTAIGCQIGFDVQGSGHTLKKNFALDNHGTGVKVSGSGNTLVKNIATLGDTPIGFHLTGDNNVLKKNAGGGVSANGFDIESSGNTLKKNSADQNGIHGIIIRNGFAGNTVMKNEATGNTAEDLFDESGNCAGNTWKANTFGTKNPNCIQ